MKLVRRAFTVFLILLLLFAVASFSFIKLYGDEIKNAIVSAFNEYINTSISVEDVKISFWEEFPSASLEFRNVCAYSSNKEDDTLIHLEQLNASFNLFEFYKKNYQLTGLSLINGKCNIEIDKNGNPNFLILKESNNTSKNFHFNLRQVNIKEVDFYYQDSPNKIDLQFFINKTRAKGDFTENIYDLELNSSLTEFFLQSDTWVILNNKSVHLSGTAKINQEHKWLELANNAIQVEELKLYGSGIINYGENTELDLILETQNQDLKLAISTLPQNIKNSLSDYSIEGNASLKGYIKGKVSSLKNPSYRFDFHVDNAVLKKNKTSLVFKETQLDGYIENGATNKLESTVLELSNFKSILKNGEVSGSLSLKNFKQPTYQLFGSMKFDLQEMVDFAGLKDVKHASGKLNANYSISGKLESINNYSVSDFKASRLSAQMILEELNFEEIENNLEVKNLSGVLDIEGNQIMVSDLNAEVNTNPLQFKGKVANLIPYLSEQNENLILDLKCHSTAFNVDDFIQKTYNKKEQNKPFNLPKDLILYLEGEFDYLKYDQHDLRQLSLNLYLDKNRIDVRELNFKSLGGKFRGDVFLKKTSKGFQFLSSSQLEQIEIKQLFEAFNHFGQETIKSSNVSGRLNSNLKTNFLLDEKLSVDLSSLKLDADLHIENGELNNVKSLEALSNYIELNELKNIKFETLQNQIYVQNEQVYIPKMEVKSSALNLTISGEHSFKNEINYHFELLLNEVLGKKVKRPQNEEFGYVEDDGLGRTKIFLQMSGTVDHPEFSYDSDELKSHLKKEVDQEKKTIKKILNEEFGLFKKDSSFRNIELDPPKKKSPFKIEWEDNKNMPDSVETEKKSKKKGKFGKFIDKIAKPNEDEFVEPIEN